jgi:hypothetical protein
MLPPVAKPSPSLDLLRGLLHPLTGSCRQCRRRGSSSSKRGPLRLPAAQQQQQGGGSPAAGSPQMGHAIAATTSRNALHAAQRRMAEPPGSQWPADCRPP